VVDEAEAGIYKIHRVRLSESIQSSLQRACVVRDVKAVVRGVKVACTRLRRRSTSRADIHGIPT